MDVSIATRGLFLGSLIAVTACGPASADRWAEGERKPVSVSSTESRLDLEIDRTGMYTIFSEGELDVVCRLLDAAGAQLAADDDSGQGMNCSMTAMLTEGAYQIEVVGFETDDKGQARVAYEALSSQEVAVDDVVAIDVSGQSGTVITFDIVQDGAYLLSTSGQLDTVCTLYNDQGVELGRDDDSGDGSNCSLNQRFSAGAYRVIVSSFGDQGGTATFMLAPSEIKSFPLSVGTPTSARIEDAGGRVEFDVSISDSGRYILRTSGDTDTVCELRSMDGAVMGENDDGDDQNCQITHALPEGDYRFVVSGFSGTTGSFMAHLDTR